MPADLSVIGYDDSPLAAQLWPALTTVRLPVRELGRQAGELLLAEFQNRPALPVSIRPSLVVRDSCQPPRVS